MGVFSYLLSAVALTGVVLNVFKLRVCFVLWFFTNGYWCVVSVRNALYLLEYDPLRSHDMFAQAGQYFIYWCLAILGLWWWSRGEKNMGKEQVDNNS